MKYRIIIVIPTLYGVHSQVIEFPTKKEAEEIIESLAEQARGKQSLDIWGLYR